MPKAKAVKKAKPMWRPVSAKVKRVIDALAKQHPGAWTELHFTNAYELLVATVLSAQSTDARVNTVTPALFERYPDARALSRATTDELQPQLVPTGFFRAKARALAGLSAALVERHGGEVPADMDKLTALPGVGRKTANVVLGHAFGVPGLPVDRHVLRVANRIGIANSDDPEVVEAQLTGALQDDKWVLASDVLILHGRRICRPRPLCDRCAVRADCDYYKALGANRRRQGSGGPPKRSAKAEGPRRRRKQATPEPERRRATPEPERRRATPERKRRRA
ncbi:MAG: endonuclease III [Vicinamibacterales bacterium]